METEESEGLVDEQPASEAAAADGEADGHKRKRRRRRRGRPGEPRDGAPAREENGVPRVALTAIPGAVADEAESDDDEADEQPGMARTDQATGERRPRRRGRRGGRRRRGGPEDGLAGSIADELAPAPPSEVSSAVADFDEVTPQPPAPAVAGREPSQPLPNRTLRIAIMRSRLRTAAPEEDLREAESVREAERAVPRRSTVREKVSFLSEPQPVATSSADHGEPQPAAPAPDESAGSGIRRNPAPPRGMVVAALR